MLVISDTHDTIVNVNRQYHFSFSAFRDCNRNFYYIELLCYDEQSKHYTVASNLNEQSARKIMDKVIQKIKGNCDIIDFAEL